jgi:hypothetical protein
MLRQSVKLTSATGSLRARATHWRASRQWHTGGRGGGPERYSGALKTTAVRPLGVVSSSRMAITVRSCCLIEGSIRGKISSVYDRALTGIPSSMAPQWN